MQWKKQINISHPYKEGISSSQEAAYTPAEVEARKASANWASDQSDEIVQSVINIFTQFI